MTQDLKNHILLFLGLVIFSIVILASGLTRLNLQPGLPMPDLSDGKIITANARNDAPVIVKVDEFFEIFLALILLGYIAFVVYKLIKGVKWKELRSTLLQFTIFAAIFSIITAFIIMLLPKGEIPPVEEIPLATPEPVVRSPLGAVPPLLLWIVGICLLVISILAGIWIYRLLTRKTTALDMIKLEAEKARRALLTGQDFKDVIIKCYRQMNLAVAQDQGIQREAFMTTREFETVLEETGLPRASIHQLTLLFESVRYGHWQANKRDEQLASRCLEDIIQYCSENKAAD